MENKLPEDVKKEILNEASFYANMEVQENPQLYVSWEQINRAYRKGANEWAQWKIKYDELVAENERLKVVNKNLEARDESKLRAYNSLSDDYQALKERCEKMEAALKDIIKMSNAGETLSHIDSHVAAKARKALKEGESNTPAPGEGKEAKEGLIRLILAGAAEVSKDAESAKEYLKGEGIDVDKVMEDGRYIQWKAELIKLVSEATGESTIKLNDTEARKWYDDGATPYQTFRETWNME